jgi:hypothetical protein
MIDVFIPRFEPPLFEKAVSSLRAHSAVKTVMILAAEGALDLTRFGAALQQCPLKIFGGVFPAVLYQGMPQYEGVLLIGIDREAEISLITELNQLQNFTANQELQSKSGFLFIDAMAGGKDAFLAHFYNTFGIKMNLVGGGAGSLSFSQIPCIISNGGLNNNAAILATFDGQFEVSVAHGWTPVSDIMKVTETKGRELVSINWEPAYEVYRSFVEQHSGQQLSEHAFFDLAKSYPFGRPLIQAEYVIRDPISTNGKSIMLVDSLAPNEFVYIMHGEIDSLIAGAKRARGKLRTIEEKGLICFDCISRVLFLGDQFQFETAAVSNDQHLKGALTIGELANVGEGYLELYNKTICLATM